MHNLKYLFACIPSLMCLLGNYYGGLATGINIIYSMVFLPLAEWYIPNNLEKNNEDDNQIVPTLVLLLLSLLHFTVTVSLLYSIFTHKIDGLYLLLAIISSGINAGTNGIVVAHELIHRKSLLLRSLGIFNLIQVNYGHFYIEHIKGHHKYVGTEADPATAKYNESLYKFFFRTIPGQFLSAFVLEKKRIYNKNYSQIRNFVIIISIIEIISITFICLLWGTKVMVAFILYSIVAILLLEYVNYIEHYGLTRNDSKKFEAHHAWQSNKISSRLGLIELSRHADHHMKANKPYQTLNSHPGYYLPSGYYGMFYLALIPSLWFKTINPIIDANKHKYN